jgi:5-methylthioadenosine/S-adenosylhomocysteine deaminase
MMFSGSTTNAEASCDGRTSRAAGARPNGTLERAAIVGQNKGRRSDREEAAMSLVITNAHVVTGDGYDKRFDRADIVIEGDRIKAIGPGAGRAAASTPDAERIDGASLIAMPGLVDAHIHSPEAFQQAVYGNAPLEPWLLQACSPFGYPQLSEREQYLRTMLAAILAIRGGATTVQDDFIYPPATPEALNGAIRAYVDCGIRAWAAVDMWDKSFRGSLPYVGKVFGAAEQAALDALPLATAKTQVDLFEHHYKNWHGHDGRIRVIIAPCGPQRCTPDLLREVNRISKERRIPLHSHCLETKLQAIQAREEYGMSFVEYFDSLGLLSDRLTLIHAIWLTDRDIAMMGEAGATMVHNPLSNLKTGAGVAPIRKQLKAGIAIGLGTDGVCTADGVDMIECVHAGSIMHTLGSPDYDEWVSAAEVFRMATMGGARTGLMEKEVGSLEPGKKADLILFDRDHWGFIPLSDPVRHLAYSITSEAIRHSIVNGRIVMRDRKLTLIDEAAIKGEIREAAERFLRDHVSAMHEGAKPYLDGIRRMHLKAHAARLSLGHLPRFAEAGAQVTAVPWAAPTVALATAAPAARSRRPARKRPAKRRAPVRAKRPAAKAKRSVRKAKRRR